MRCEEERKRKIKQEEKDKKKRKKRNWFASVTQNSFLLSVIGKKDIETRSGCSLSSMNLINGDITRVMDNNVGRLCRDTVVLSVMRFFCPFLDSTSGRLLLRHLLSSMREKTVILLCV